MISARQISRSAHVTVRVCGVDDAGDVPAADAEEGDGGPAPEEGEKQEEAENICA